MSLAMIGSPASMNSKSLFGVHQYTASCVPRHVGDDADVCGCGVQKHFVLAHSLAVEDATTSDTQRLGEGTGSGLPASKPGPMKTEGGIVLDDRHRRCKVLEVTRCCVTALEQQDRNAAGYRELRRRRDPSARLMRRRRGAVEDDLRSLDLVPRFHERRDRLVDRDHEIRTRDEPSFDRDEKPRESLPQKRPLLRVEFVGVVDEVRFVSLGAAIAAAPSCGRSCATYTSAGRTEGLGEGMCRGTRKNRCQGITEAELETWGGSLGRFPITRNCPTDDKPTSG